MLPSRPGYCRKGKPMYQRSIVTFIDILGFRDIVNKKSAHEIDDILNILNRVAAPSRSEEHQDPYDPTVLSFSDSIIRVRNLETDDNIAFPIGHLFHEVNSLVHIQMDLITRGVLIRGGVSIGPTRVAKDRIFGTAFIKAYELESKFAASPRIIIGPELINAVDTDVLVVNENHTADEERGYLKKQLAKGDDGLCYVDYLRASRLELDDPDYYLEFLRKHKKLIVTQGGEHSTLSSVSSKYIWLASYHNKVISELREEYFAHYSLDKSELLITQAELSALSNL